MSESSCLPRATGDRMTADPAAAQRAAARSTRSRR